MPGKNTGGGCHFLLDPHNPEGLSLSGIKLASPVSPYHREILYMLSNWGNIKEEHEE